MPIAAIVLLWIPAVLWVDRTASPELQLLLGALTWAMLIGMLWRASPLLRAQTLVVVAFAATVEYVFSAWLGVYEYRLGDVPAYVPPGHGLVYLAALGLAGAVAGSRWEAPAVVATVVVGAALAAWGLWWSPRTDVLGAFWFLCLVGFLLWGRSRTLYVGAFVVVSWLEFLGTAWGVWAWMPYDTILGVVPMGNPPSVAAGGYGWFDLAAVLLAPALVVLWRRLRGQQADDLVVEQPVGAHGAAEAGAAVRG